MPTFWSMGTSIRLSTTKAGTTELIDHDQIKRHSHSSARDLRASGATGEESIPKIVEHLTESSFLDSDQDGNSMLRFVGPNKDIPFFLIRSGKDLFQQGLDQVTPPQPSPKRSPGLFINDAKDGMTTEHIPEAPLSPAAPIDASNVEGEELPRKDCVSSTVAPLGIDQSPQSEQAVHTNMSSPPRALTLTIKLGKPPFVLSGLRDVATNDVYITVFFNGELMASRFVARQSIKSSWRHQLLEQTFTGRRVGPGLEKRWVLVTARQNGEDTCRLSEEASEKVDDRWTRLGTILKQEAEKWGVNKRGQRSVIGAYLAALAVLPVPEDAKEIQNHSGPRFGVIDVLITRGLGKKETGSARYIREPQRFLDPNFPSRPDEYLFQPPPSGIIFSQHRSRAARPTLSAVLRRIPSPVSRPLSLTSLSTRTLTNNQAQTLSSQHPGLVVAPTPARSAQSKPSALKRLPALRRHSKSKSVDEFPATLDDSTTSLSLSAGGPDGKATNLSICAAGEVRPRSTRRPSVSSGDRTAKATVVATGAPMVPNMSQKLVPVKRVLADGERKTSESMHQARKRSVEAQGGSTSSLTQSPRKAPVVSSQAQQLSYVPTLPSMQANLSSTPSQVVPSSSSGSPAQRADQSPNNGAAQNNQHDPLPFNENCTIAYAADLQALGSERTGNGRHEPPTALTLRRASRDERTDGPDMIPSVEVFDQDGQVNAYSTCKYEKGATFEARSVVVGVRFMIG